MEVQTHPMHPLKKVILRFLGVFLPPVLDPPHATIEPSALRAAKAYSFEEISVLQRGVT
jgi:hypothetical protein